ncbi:hypothetical protein [Streptomyces sp. NPDC055107]
MAPQPSGGKTAPVNTLPPRSDPLLLPVRDPRTRDLVLDCAALRPVRAVAMLRAVFDAVSLLLRPPSAPEATAAEVTRSFL